MHRSYVQGDNGFFHPDQTITRAQTAQMLYNLEISQPGARQFSDVAGTQWYASAVAQLSGILTGYEDGTFRPNAEVTMAEFITVLCRALDLEEEAVMLGEEPGDPWYTPYWSVAAVRRWFPEGREYQGDEPVTRATAVVMVNHALGRVPDSEILNSFNQVYFVDVALDHWAYEEILEAAIGHQHGSDGSWAPGSYTLQALPAGVYVSGGAGYYVEPSGTLYRTPGILELNGESYLVADSTGRIWADNAIHSYGNTLVCCAGNGTLLKGNSFNGFLFDAEGYYTSGSEEIDGYVEAILAEYTDESMTQMEKLRAVFDRVRSYGYLGPNATITNAVMSREQATAYAAKIFETGKGDCYNFTALFTACARRLGYQAYNVAGHEWSPDNDHAWTMITWPDGVTYLFDVQLEYAYLYMYANKPQIDMFKVSGGNGSYNGFAYYFP